MRGLLAISLLMMERRDERDVLHLAATAVPSLARCRTVGVHLTGRGWQTWSPTDATTLDALALALGGRPAGGPVVVPGERWAFALPLPSLEETVGHLVVAATAEPAPNELALLRSLTQQAGVAIANARVHAGREATNAALAETVAALERKTAIHDRFTEVALTGAGRDGIVRALYELTGLAAGIEDRNGVLMAWAGPTDRPAEAGDRRVARDDPRAGGYAAEPARARLVEQALRAGRPIRSHGRLLTAVRSRPDVIGLVYLDDPDGSAGTDATVALEHAATVLAIELARLLSLAETELRLGMGVVDDVVTGTDHAGAARRAEALGRDLARPHRVVVVGTARATPEPDALGHAVRAALEATGAPLLLQRAAHVVVLLEVGSPADRSAVERLAQALRGSPLGRWVRIGVGGVCLAPEDFPRSHREALLALRFLSIEGERAVLAVHDDLGVYQLLAEVADPAGVEWFVRRWLGPLLDYDVRRHAQLVRTLAAYLHTGGRYDATAADLSIGRSTLRYRLARIRELSGHDLNDPDTRFQLQLATTAWFMRSS